MGNDNPPRGIAYKVEKKNPRKERTITDNCTLYGVDSTPATITGGRASFP